MLDNLLPFKSEFDKPCNWFKVFILSLSLTSGESKYAPKLAVWYCSVLIIPDVCSISTVPVSLLYVAFVISPKP